MPRLPIQTAPTVGLQPISGPGPVGGGSTGLGRLGAGIAEGVQGITGAIAEVQQRAEEASEMEASAELELYATSIYDNPEGGLLHKYGREAFEATDTALGQLEKRRQDLMRSLSAGARARFDLRTRSLVEQRRRQGEAHAARQRHVVEGVAVDTRLKASITTIGQTDDPEVRARSIAVALDAIRAFQKAPDKLAKAQSGFLEMAHSAAITHMLAQGDADGAQAYLSEHREELGQLAAKFQRDIDRAGIDSAGEAAAIRFVEMARGDGGRVDENRARDLLDTITDVALRDEARQRLEARLKAEDQQWKATVAGVYDRAFTAYLSGGPDAIDGNDKRWLIDNEPDAWDKLRMKIRRDSDHYRVLRDRSAETPEQRQAFVELQAEMVMDPDRYASMTPQQFTAEWGHRLSASAYKSGGKMLAGTQRRSLVDPQEFRLAVDAAMTRNGITQKGDQDLFAAYMKSRLDEHSASSTKPPTREQMQTWLDGATSDVLVEDWVFDDRMKRYKVPAGRKIIGEPEPAPRPLTGPTVVERRRGKDGRMLEKLSDGTIRVAQ